MPDSPPVDRKVEALESESPFKYYNWASRRFINIGVDKARQAVKIAEEAFQAVSSEYDRVMSIKTGTKGGGKGMEFCLWIHH